MVIRQLEYFIQICKVGSFTKAAEVLMVSQPTLSQQIRLLEHEFGVSLFDRVGRGIEITEAGKILFQKSIAIMGMIVTILSCHLVKSYDYPNIKLIRLTDPSPTCKIKLIYPKYKVMPHTTKAFIDYMSEFIIEPNKRSELM